MTSRLLPILLATVLLGALGACGGTSAGDDVTWTFPDNGPVDVAWGGNETVKPADVATGDGGPDDGAGSVDARPDGPDVSSDVDALTPAEPIPDGAEPTADVGEPAPDGVSDPGLDPGPGDPDAVEALPDVPDPVDTVEPAPDVPPPPDNVECSLAAHCDDQKPCTVDSCLPGGTCQHTKAFDNSPCEDGNVCTTGDYCLSGLCFQGSVKDCDDGNDCTTDACVPGVGCKATPKTGGTCNDGDACTGNDTCAGGVCQPGPIDLCPICGDDVCGEPYETCEDCTADCGACSETACADGVDEDWDGATDCADSDCAHVLPCYEAACGDAADNDADGATDCADPDCGATEPCIETSCADTVDNDGDGTTDCADSQCAAAAACLPPVCQGAVALSCGQTTATERAASNHLNGYSGCSAQTASGADDIYVVVVPTGVTSVSASLSIVDDDDDDLDLYLLKGQCYATQCVDSSTGGSWSESVSSSASPGQVFFFVVEEYSSFGWGDYKLSITCD